MREADVFLYNRDNGRWTEIKPRMHSPIGEAVRRVVQKPALEVHHGAHNQEKTEKVIADLKALGAFGSVIGALASQVNGNQTHAVSWLYGKEAYVGFVEHPSSGASKVPIVRIARVR